MKLAKSEQTLPEKVAFLMKSGYTDPELIKNAFKDTPHERVMYRLPALINTIKNAGGIVKVRKQGRKVIAYELLNGHKFNDIGRYTKE